MMESTHSNSGDSSFMSKYQIGEAIGKGAFGKVYKALNTETGDFFAVKQIEKSIISEKQLPAIIQELKLLKTLQHVNIVKFIESHETSKHLYFALEFIEGGSLAKIAKRYGNFQEPLLSRYISQVLRGIEYLHDKGVIHRDIKSDNILITKEGVIKLADFGSCTYSALDRKLTVVGTPFWMAPEVIQMDMNARSTACDIWSLGCTILELLTGSPPYWELGTMPAMFAMVNNPHPPLPAKISPELKKFLMSCFVRDINKRPTASQLLDHPWIKMHAQQQQVKVVLPPPMSQMDDDSSPDEQEDDNGSLDMRERVAELEAQRKDMTHTIQKLKIHFIRAMREKKLMRELIAQLVQERDGYMVDLGLTPPPPPSILQQTSHSSSGHNSIGKTSPVVDTSTTELPMPESPTASSKHARSSSVPISPPIKIASSSPSPLTSGPSLQSSSSHNKSSSNILSAEFFQQPAMSAATSVDSDSEHEENGGVDQGVLLTTLNELHQQQQQQKARRTPPRLSRDNDRPEHTSNPSGLGGYLSSETNVHVYQGVAVAPTNVHVNAFASSPSLYNVGGSLSGIGGPTSTTKKSPTSSILQRESSHKSQINQYVSSPLQQNGHRSENSILNGGGNSSGSLNSPNGSRKGSQSIPPLSIDQTTLLSSTSLSSSSSSSSGTHTSIAPVESVVVNVQPPRIGDECKVKCGDCWYDALVELVSGTSTIVITIKPFNIKQEVSQSSITLAPLQFPVSTKKKSKLSSIFSSGSSSNNVVVGSSISSGLSSNKL
ncbi:hypothetical protein SAMD00019534_000560 [Acytostelium subglobosum LB1]|uniref:hypothetical protein n=1 Tax=Acytostelium subglobosum LB1 TaxID=1410327 RepID=UPI000644D42A|nr:hypothetical protein SAMD00019534_000560 [Acytostelium subglobosum LB1]GAM16881.1 hypothetical protein SAMD00019534_000560 [Acytostelium subglobosum LB1]|eukprot:XP_012758943.1 hypothetical protein SAMD00019534_000560 [Acytostelium subglobosum LB1]